MSDRGSIPRGSTILAVLLASALAACSIVRSEVDRCLRDPNACLPPAPTAAPTPLLYCEGDAMACPHGPCWTCLDQPGDRERLGVASTECVRRVLVTCPTPEPLCPAGHHVVWHFPDHRPGDYHCDSDLPCVGLDAAGWQVDENGDRCSTPTPTPCPPGTVPHAVGDARQPPICVAPTPSPTRTPNVSVTPAPPPCPAGQHVTWSSHGSYACGYDQTPTPTPEPTEVCEPAGDGCNTKCCRDQGNGVSICTTTAVYCPRPTPSPTRTPNTSVTPTPPATPSPAPTPSSSPTPGPGTPEPPQCAGAPEPPLDRPVSLLRTGGRCPHGFDPVDYNPPLCVARSVCHEPGKTKPGTDEPVCPGIGSWWAWAVENALGSGAWQLSPDGFIWDGGRGWYDADARVWRSNDVDMPSAPPEGAPTYGLRDPDGTEHNAPGYSGDGPGFIGVSGPLRCTPAPPTPAPGTPTPAPVPADRACHLPPGEGDGVDCPRTTPQLLPTEDAALGRVLSAHPDWFTTTASSSSGAISGSAAMSTTRIVPGHENDFRYSVVDELRKAGACAFFDGEEVAVKTSNDFSEQYNVLASDGRVRRGENSYRATCTPAWKEIPATKAIEPPLLVLWKVGSDCRNPKDGPKYRNGLCIVDSTAVFRDPATPDDGTRDSPCDEEHHVGWDSYCHGMRWDDERGPERSVTGAEARIDGDNPFWTDVTFSPGQTFTICVRPRSDVNANGVGIPVRGAAEQCHQVTP